MPKHAALPRAVRGCTHYRLGHIRDIPDSSIEVRMELGSEDDDGAFVPDPWLGTVRLVLPKPHADAVRARAAGAGAPVGPLGQEWRLADLWRYLTDIDFDPTKDPR